MYLQSQEKRTEDPANCCAEVNENNTSEHESVFTKRYLHTDYQHYSAGILQLYHHMLYAPMFRAVCCLHLHVIPKKDFPLPQTRWQQAPLEYLYLFTSPHEDAIYLYSVSQGSAECRSGFCEKSRNKK